CLGKIIGGGLPVGAYGGTEKIMNHLAPVGEVYQASTFAGNPVVMQAGLTTLRILSRLKNEYKALINTTKDLSEATRKEAEKNGIDLEVSYYGTMFSFKFGKKSQFKNFFWKLISEGIYIAPSEYEANFVSFVHTEKDIDRTKKAIKRAL
ncbi:MAG: aminotransferase class III-fold pyridoxal phosphate-dependent enzyme, partial [Candidatus Omnitrophota bacterium]